jgi:hypothetical protein
MGNGTVFRTVFFRKSGERATPVVEGQRQAFNDDNPYRCEQSPVISSGNSTVKDIEQAEYHKPEQDRVNEFDEEYFFVGHLASSLVIFIHGGSQSLGKQAEYRLADLGYHSGDNVFFLGGEVAEYIGDDISLFV